MIDTAIRLTLMLSIPMCTGILMLSADIIPWFLGEKYESCIGLLQIFSLLMVIVGLNNIVGKQCLMAAGRQKYYNYGVVAGAIVNAAANCILIPRYASSGAAVASVLSETVILIIFIIFGRDYLGAFYTYLSCSMKYFAASAVMGAVVFLVKSCMAGGIWRVCAAGIAGMLVYGAILLIVQDEFAKAVTKRMETFITNINKR